MEKIKSTQKNTQKTMNGSSSPRTENKVPLLFPSPHLSPLAPSIPTSFPFLQPPEANSSSGTIGITTYAASALGDVVFIELPEVGQEVSAGDTIGAVESVKSASDILTPLSGKVIAANEALEGKPSIINKAPEGEGWIARIELKIGEEEGEGEKENLMDAEEYRKFTEEV